MSLIPVDHILETFAIPGGLTVTRRAAGTETAGIYTPGATTTLTVDPIVVQPVAGRTLARMPEGQRTREPVSVWTRAELRTAQDPSGAMADRFTYGGALYEVAEVHAWAAQGGYYSYTAIKVATS
jgi:hypothetical protein